MESRATIFNPEYVKEVMKGGASSASQITEVVTNTYGWNVTKPDVIDKEMWDRIYDVYVEDSYGLGTEQFFRQQNPAALQEITAVMLETARKGMWKASEQQLNTLGEPAYGAGRRVRLDGQRILGRQRQIAGIHRRTGRSAACGGLQTADPDHEDRTKPG